MKLIALLSFILSFVIGISLAVPTGTFKLTNAQRFARGLPPAPPRAIAKDARGPSGTVDYPDYGKRWGGGLEPSSKPCSGKIKVWDKTTGDFLGYVNKTFTDVGLYDITLDEDAALTVTFNARPNKVTTLKASNNPVSTFPFLAFIIPAFNFNTGTLKTGSADYVFLGGAKSSTPPNSKPVAVGNSHTRPDIADNGVETAVWTYNEGAGGSLTSSWVNSNGDDASVTAFFHEGGFIGLTGDIDAFKDFADSPVHTVRFTLG